MRLSKRNRNKLNIGIIVLFSTLTLFLIIKEYKSDKLGSNQLQTSRIDIINDQKLSGEKNQKPGSVKEVTVSAEKSDGLEDLDFSSRRSPETYFGALRNMNLGNGRSGIIGIASFEAPKSPRTSTLYLPLVNNVLPMYEEL